MLTVIFKNKRKKKVSRIETPFYKFSKTYFYSFSYSELPPTAPMSSIEVGNIAFCVGSTAV